MYHPYYTFTSGEAPPPPVIDTVAPSGGILGQQLREALEGRQVLKARREVLRVIEQVAVRQVKTLQTDKQKQFEELE